MKNITKGLALAVIIVFFVGCKPMDTLNQHSFTLSVVPLNTINGEKPTSLVGVVCDGASSVELRLEHKSTIVPSGIVINADSKFGTFSTGNSNFDCTVIKYTAPEQFPGTDGQNVVNFPITIKVTAGDGNVFYETELKLIRTPVLMVHGMSSSSVDFAPLKGEFVNSGNYAEFSLRTVDYAATSFSSYQSNKDVVPVGIDSLRKQCLRSGYVANKVNVVGHGTGAILSRLYFQNTNYRYDIARFITIDAPHSGSQLANFAISLGDAGPNTILSLLPTLGALSDMQVGSSATDDLNGLSLNKVKVPTHTISSTNTSNDYVMELIDKQQYTAALVAYLSDEFTQKLMFDERNDVFVAKSSQDGGLTDLYSTNYNGPWHYSILNDPTLTSDIVALLAWPTKGESSPFSLDGFRPATLTYTEPMIGLYTFSDPNPVTYCTRGQSVVVEFTTPKSVAGSLFIITQTGSDGKDKICYMDDRTFDNTTFTFDVPADAPNSYKFHLLAREGSNSGGSALSYYFSTQYSVNVN